MPISFSPLRACVDCLVYAANGDLPEDDARAKEIEAAFSARRSISVGDMGNEFSWRACDCCGSPLGGSRHELLEQDE